MKILVIGSRGTLGKPLVRELEKRGHIVYQADLMHQGIDNYQRCDISSQMQVNRLFEDNKFDHVYLLAAEFGRHNGEDFYDTLWKTNVIGTRNVLEAQAYHDFPLIFTSSSEIYGESGETWLDEDLPNKKPIFQQNDYAISKWVNEQQILNFTERASTETVRLRLFNAYGPGEAYHRYRSVVCLFTYRALSGLPYEVYEGYHRVFQYIDDLIPTMANVVDNYKAGEVYNLGGIEYRSVRELSDIILDITGSSSEVTYLPEDAHNTKNKRPFIEKAAQELGHAPIVELEEGVPATIDWMCKEYGLQKKVVKLKSA